MRLWHKDLIPVLPRQQLLAQWRECCCIARNIAVKGSPNHILVNVVLEYPLGMFTTYTRLVRDEMSQRGYKISVRSLRNYKANINKCSIKLDNYNIIETGPIETLYTDWHNDRYLTQCFYNLQEKYDRGGISADEWKQIEHFYFNARKKFKRELLK